MKNKKRIIKAVIVAVCILNCEAKVENHNFERTDPSLILESILRLSHKYSNGTWTSAHTAAGKRKFVIETDGTNRYAAVVCDYVPAVTGLGQFIDGGFYAGEVQFSYDMRYLAVDSRAAYRIVVIGINANGSSQVCSKLTGGEAMREIEAPEAVNQDVSKGLFHDVSGRARGDILYDSTVTGLSGKSDWKTVSKTFTVDKKYTYLGIKIMVTGVRTDVTQAYVHFDNINLNVK
ncbi:MAG: hypothetical protein WC959_02490 [Kiritimatiellales bacterium]